MPLLLLPSAPYSIGGRASGAQAPQSGLAIGSVSIPATLATVLPSYAYQQYSDDVTIAAFIASYNTLTQGYLNWFNQTPLGVYTNPNISGPLLDWVGEGVYGISRPVFSTIFRKVQGGVNSRAVNALPINGDWLFQSGSLTVATDDFYRRVITWYAYLGDGRRFSTTFIRRRIARFLYGVNGGDISPSLANNVHILDGFLGPPPQPQLSAFSQPVTYTFLAGINALPVNAKSINGGRLRVRSPYGGLGGINSYPVNGLATNAIKVRSIVVWTTYVTPTGETLPSVPAVIQLPRGQGLFVFSPPSMAQNYALRFRAGVNSLPIGGLPVNSGRKRANGTINENGVIGWNVYTLNKRGVKKLFFRGAVGSVPIGGVAVNGSRFLKTYLFGQRQNLVPVAIGTNWQEPNAGFVQGAPLPTKNTSNVIGNIIVTVPTGLPAQLFQEALGQSILPLPTQITATVLLR